MSDSRRDKHPDADASRQARAGSELEEGLDHLGKAVGGVLTRLLGSRYTQVELDPDRPVISPEADRALDRAGEAVGRWLHAAGEGLASHPTDPSAAIDHASRHKGDDLDLREGEAPLAAGVRALASGLYRSTEAVLDVVAPRRSKGSADGPGGSADPSAQDSGPEDSGPEDSGPEDSGPDITESDD